MTPHTDQVLRMLAEQNDYWHGRAVIKSVTGLWDGHVDAAIARLKASGEILYKSVPDGRGQVEEVYTVPRS